MLVHADKGQTIENFCAQLVLATWYANRTIYGHFNGHLLVARLRSTRADLMNQWFESCKRQSLVCDPLDIRSIQQRRM